MLLMLIKLQKLKRHLQKKHSLKIEHNKNASERSEAFLLYDSCKLSTVLLLTFFINKFRFKSAVADIHVLQPVPQIMLYGVERV